MFLKVSKRVFLFMSSFVAGITCILSAPSAFADKPIPAEGFAGGKGSPLSPYIIMTPEQLEFLAESVNSGNDYFDKYIKLTKDLDFTPYEGENNHTPIGNRLHPFSGSLYGAGHVIKGIMVNNPQEDYQGLFGLIAVRDGVPISVTRLSVSGGQVIGNKYVGGIIGAISSNSTYSSELARLVNQNNVLGKFSVGGIIGVVAGNISMNDITNSGHISSFGGEGDVIGGIAGLLETRISAMLYNLQNCGNINGNLYVGGIAGYVRYQGYLYTEGFQNQGKIDGKGHKDNFIGLTKNKKSRNIFKNYNAASLDSIFQFQNEDTSNVITSKSFDNLVNLDEDTLKEFGKVARENIQMHVFGYLK